MSDRTWVSLSVSTLRTNSISDDEDIVFKMLCNGEAPRLDSLTGTLVLDRSLDVEDEGVVDVDRDHLAYRYGVSEVRVGDMADAADAVVNLMRNGETPKRSFVADEDGYGGDLGWRYEYDAATDRVVQGSAANGSFQIGLDDLVRWYNDHNRDGDAMMRMVIKQFNVKLRRPPSPVIALIERINRQHI